MSRLVERLKKLAKTPERKIQEGKAWYEDRIKGKEDLHLQLKANIKPSPERNEIKRICDLPLMFGLESREFEDFNKRVVLADQFEMGWRLFPIQADALDFYLKFGGLFGPIAVGWGKTLICLKIAHFAYQKGIEKILLLIPPQAYYQLTKHDIPFYRTKTTLAVPFNLMGKLNRERRKILAKSNRPGCYIFPYSLLSTVDAIDNLNEINPGLIICDEVHLVKNRKAVRTKRLFNFIHEHKPEVVGVSGTITSKGLEDYWHVIRACLHELAPVPLTAMIARDWAGIINANAVFLETKQLKPMLPLLSWARRFFPEEEYYENTTGIRKAFQKRLVTAPGVVATSDEEIGTSLVLENKRVKDYKNSENWDLLSELISNVQDDYITPAGDEIDHAIHTFKWLYELSSGFYNNLVWPDPEIYAKRKKISTREATRNIALAKEHHAASQEYTKELRNFLIVGAKPGYDSPLLVGLEIARNGAKNVGQKLARLWEIVKSMEFEGMPIRDSVQIRVCPYKRDDAVSWAMDLKKKFKNKGGIIWIYHQEMGRWIHEGLLEAGIDDALYCEAGAVHNASILAPENGKRILVASWPAHGESKNLQHFQHVYFAQWPRNAKGAEQILGRVHRNGQEADELVIRTNNTLHFDDIVLAACLSDALYIQQTTSIRQKLIYATWNPMPKIYSPEFLRERGMENRPLTLQQKRDLRERFGGFNDGKASFIAEAS